MWTNVLKPTSSTYAYVNPIGKEFYDDSMVMYDSNTTFYDGVNPAEWTDVNKPTSSVWTFINKPV